MTRNNFSNIFFLKKIPKINYKFFKNYQNVAAQRFLKKMIFFSVVLIVNFGIYKLSIQFIALNAFKIAITRATEFEFIMVKAYAVVETLILFKRRAFVRNIKLAIFNIESIKF